MTAAEFKKPNWKAAHLRLAVEAAGVALWTWNIARDDFAMDQRGFELWGIPRRKTATFEVLSGCIHPADRDRVRTAFDATRAMPGAYEIDFRIMVDDAIRWISARGQGEDPGVASKNLFGVFLDVTGRKLAEEGNELLAGEMSHRVKNLLAIATGLTAITGRSSTTAAEMAADLTQRLVSLGRAHDLVRPEPGAAVEAALFGDLLALLLAPYDNDDPNNSRIRVAVQRVAVGESTATTLALIVHELATNSLKHGALSVDGGTLDVSSTVEDGKVVMVWVEHGGPQPKPPEQQPGFGSKLVERSVTGALRGSIDYDWTDSGLVVTLRMNAERLAA